MSRASPLKFARGGWKQAGYWRHMKEFKRDFWKSVRKEFKQDILKGRE